MNNYKIKSPSYFGKMPNSYKIGDIEKGYDNLEWCIILKNGRNVWVRKTEDIDIINKELLNNNTLTINKTEKLKQKKKYTLYNEYLDKKMKELKETNNNLAPKDLFSLAVKEWHIIKIDKEKLNIYLNNTN